MESSLNNKTTFVTKKYSLLTFMIIVTIFINAIILFNYDKKSILSLLLISNSVLLLYFLYRIKLYIKKIEIKEGKIYLHKLYKIYSSEIDKIKIFERHEIGKRWGGSLLLSIKMENHFGKFKIYKTDFEEDDYKRIKELLGYNK